MDLKQIKFPLFGLYKLNLGIKNPFIVVFSLKTKDLTNSLIYNTIKMEKTNQRYENG